MTQSRSNQVVILLCNLTDNMAAPWIGAGYDVVMVDPQFEGSSMNDGVLRFSGTVLDALPVIGNIIRTMKVAFVAGFPPCTDVAVSGARWWDKKREADPYFQAKAAIVGEQCRMVGELSGAPYVFENPVSAFSKIFGAPSHTFHPYQYTGYCADDNYTKKTCLWSGNGFAMPDMWQRLDLGEPDDRIHKAWGDSNFRSATPRGFAKAVFLSNAPHLKAANDNQVSASAVAA